MRVCMYACMYVCVIPKALCMRCSHSADTVPRPLHLADLKTACFYDVDCLSVPQEVCKNHPYSGRPYSPQVYGGFPKLEAPKRKPGTVKVQITERRASPSASTPRAFILSDRSSSRNYNPDKVQGLGKLQRGRPHSLRRV